MGTRPPLDLSNTDVNLEFSLLFYFLFLNFSFFYADVFYFLFSIDFQYFKYFRELGHRIVNVLCVQEIVTLSI